MIAKINPIHIETGKVGLEILKSDGIWRNVQEGDPMIQQTNNRLIGYIYNIPNIPVCLSKDKQMNDKIHLVPDLSKNIPHMITLKIQGE